MSLPPQRNLGSIIQSREELVYSERLQMRAWRLCTDSLQILIFIGSGNVELLNNINGQFED